MATRSTVRAALATVEAADAATSLADLPGLLLSPLANLVGADSVLWTELDQAARLDQAAELDQSAGRLPGRITSYPGLLLDEDAAMALEQHAQVFPLMCHTRPGGDGRPIRRSDLQSMRSFRSSGVYADVVRKIGIDEMLALALKPGSLHVCISLNRTGPDFTPAAVDLLTRLRPLLTRRIARLAANRANQLAVGEGAAWPGRADLTPRQEQVLRLVASGLTDAAIGHRLGCSPRTVDKHLEHIYRRLGVSCRAAAIAAACTALMNPPAVDRPSRNAVSTDRLTRVRTWLIRSRVGSAAGLVATGLMGWSCAFSSPCCIRPLASRRNQIQVRVSFAGLYEAPKQDSNVADLGFAVERVTRIELALSAWESHRSMLMGPLSSHDRAPSVPVADPRYRG